MTTDTLIDWTYDDQLAALAEGWDIFEVRDSEHEPFELSRLDTPSDHDVGYDEPKFDDDINAWQHVIERAMAGSVLHNKALAFLMQDAPGEFVHIAMYEAGLGDSCPCLSCNRPTSAFNIIHV